jgi:glycosyltransferase involved in cell wall biosynthesis
MGKIKLLYALEAAGGGTLKHVTCLATRLSRNEFDITVVLPDEYYEQDTQSAVRQMRQHGIRVDVIPTVKRISPVMDVWALCRIYSYLGKRSFDIIHAHSSKAGVLFRLAAQWTGGVVVVYTPHCFYFTACSGLKRRFYAWVERFLAKRTHGIVISGTEQTALHWAQIRPIREIVVINNAIDPDEYSWENGLRVRRQWNIPDHHKIVVGVGRLVKQKNWEAFLETACEVLKRNVAVTFIIAGEGPHYKYLSRLAGCLGLSSNVRLCGYIEDMRPIYSMTDVFVSTSCWEGLPYAWLEALHFRLPMLIARTEGIEYLSSCPNIVCVPPNDPIRLCNEILRVTSDNYAGDTDGTVFPISVKHFVEHHRALYRRLRMT